MKTGIELIQCNLHDSQEWWYYRCWQCKFISLCFSKKEQAEHFMNEHTELHK